MKSLLKQPLFVIALAGLSLAALSQKAVTSPQTSHPVETQAGPVSSA